MAFDFSELVAPAHTAVVTCEMQRGVIGDLTTGPELAAEAFTSISVARAAATIPARRVPNQRSQRKAPACEDFTTPGRFTTSTTASRNAAA